MHFSKWIYQVSFTTHNQVVNHIKVVTCDKSCERKIVSLYLFLAEDQLQQSKSSKFPNFKILQLDLLIK